MRRPAVIHQRQKLGSLMKTECHNFVISRGQSGIISAECRRKTRYQNSDDIFGFKFGLLNYIHRIAAKFSRNNLCRFAQMIPALRKQRHAVFTLKKFFDATKRRGNAENFSGANSFFAELPVETRSAEMTESKINDCRIKSV